MNLNEFLKTDRQNAERKIKSMEFLLQDLIPDALQDGDFDGCLEMVETLKQHCEELKRMHHPIQVVQLHEIATRFFNRGINVELIRRPGS
ncbi:MULTISPECIES: YqaH family protein [Bacillus subtilis group]|uniref:Uncharacterized protein n=1 Tax=Bacillus phage phi105 TaxID=10717 RepID=Q9ZXC9_BPPH1|nr:YqaH family protein [Bacillus subtilis]NP_690790.1 hypothetical protein phi105_37 [Bacillus phage phi105]YP_009829908.1 hypothetical protein HWA84_gp34 [Bacillus phage phi105]ADF59167.1 hypothetical protein PHI105_00170 [Bacillus phage phi105]MBF8236546.1 hypothetical protein [Bacillus subtilis]BAA36663.1 unnamed protein product [Bacillus phage phi105]